MLRVLTALLVTIGLCLVPMGCNGGTDYSPEELGHDPDFEFEDREPVDDSPFMPTPGRPK